MSKPLSPAAQAVMDAYQSASDGCYVNGEWIQDHAGQIAADLFGDDPNAAALATIEHLLAIAAELDGQPLPQPPTQPTTDNTP